MNILETLTNLRAKVNVKESCNFFERKIAPAPQRRKTKFQTGANPLNGLTPVLHIRSASIWWTKAAISVGAK